VQHEPDTRVIVDQEDVERPGCARERQRHDEEGSKVVSTLSPMCTTPSWWTARQGRLVVIPIDSMSNLPTGTQETKNAFESHKAKVTNRIYEAAARIELGKCQAECCHPATCPAASVPHGDSAH
jgi:hypothetical protein